MVLNIRWSKTPVIYLVVFNVNKWDCEVFRKRTSKEYVIFMMIGLPVWANLQFGHSETRICNSEIKNKVE